MRRAALVNASDTEPDSIVTNPYVITEYEVGDYVLRRYHTTALAYLFGLDNPIQTSRLVVRTILSDSGFKSLNRICTSNLSILTQIMLPR